MISFFPQDEKVTALMSLKNDGNMKITGTHKDTTSIANRKKFCAENSIPYDSVVSSLVRHTSNASVVTNASRHFIYESDALVTKEKNLFVAVTVADCFPVAFYDPVASVVAVAHAGWRGIVGDIVPDTIDKMIACGANAENMLIEIGPGISQANFDFNFKEMVSSFGKYNHDKYVVPGSTLEKVKINLQAIILDQIEDAGVRPEHVRECAECTFADEKMFFSARRHNGNSHNAMLVLIGMHG